MGAQTIFARLARPSVRRLYAASVLIGVAFGSSMAAEPSSFEQWLATFRQEALAATESALRRAPGDRELNELRGELTRPPTGR